ncbi:MAG: TrkH family potassium uptake protein [Actinomycetia bacterium]|nr:TrkH family potassium uptake protein [Actinomycetes bacterium]MCP4960385.1 TrkH family potassium uptake protein [Actinomycetes bacterium]
MTATRAPTESLLQRRRRYPSAATHVTGIALMIVAVGMAVSAVVGFIDSGDDRWTDVWALLGSAAISAALGAAMWWLTEVPRRQKTSVAFTTVTWSWVAVSVVGALPFLFAGTFDWARVDDALFESISGFTCTGSTVIGDLSTVPKGVRFFRQMSQWFGGMGLIVLAVAILPALKVGGLELIAAEAPGPTPDRLAPQVRETAKRLWILYGGVTAVIAIALMAVGGMDLYDGIAHAFTTASTGGFSPYPASAGHFQSVTVEIVLILGMIYCGGSFALHWQAIRGDWTVYHRVSEFRIYIAMIVILIPVATVLNHDLDVGLGRRALDAAFNIATVVTSTGFGTADFTLWGPASQVLLLLLMIPAGMTGSTSGGIKILRLQVLVKYAFREITRARHPRSVSALTLGPVPVREDVVHRTMGFILLYLGATFTGGAIVTALGSDPVTGFSSAISATGNIGPALGEAGPASTFAVIPRLGRPVLMFLMLFGRLEVFPTIIATMVALRPVQRAVGVRYRRVAIRRSLPE